MILADKILTLRKNSGFSQEELAEKLNVSRQSISKWESAASIPDISKIIDMANLFGVTTDYLLKDDLEQTVYTSGDEGGARRMSVEEANAYLDDSHAYAKKIALGVMLCILSPVLLITLPVLIPYLSSVAQGGAIVISEAQEALYAGVGLVALFLLVACAVGLFIVSSATERKYKYIDRSEFELAYGVEGVLRQKWSNYETRYTASIAVGVILCILSPIPLIIAGLAEASDLVCILFTALLLVIIAIAVYIFIVAGSEKECYDKLLREEDYEGSNAKTSKQNEKIGGIYWPIVTAAYLAWSFISMRWEITWLIWPVAGVLFGAVCAIVKIAAKTEQ